MKKGISTQRAPSEQLLFHVQILLVLEIEDEHQIGQALG